jgi:nucleoside phosphorylase
MPSECAPVACALRRRRIRKRFLLVGTWHDRPVGLLLLGVGQRHAQDRVRAALACWDAARVVSFGTCGALVDDLSVGDVVTATAFSGQEFPIAPVPGVRQVRLASVHRVVASAERRSALAAEGADVVEMEAAGVALGAGSRAFHALKVVSDEAGVRPDPVFRWSGRYLRRVMFEQRALRLVASKLLPVLDAWMAGL